jgi:hypothetical protein
MLRGQEAEERRGEKSKTTVKEGALRIERKKERAIVKIMENAAIF